ncbi:hypothetical protein GCM10007358_01840 [Phocicoccus schoeneichii]|nr:hypothetical protein GCM10007358_01840 [Jeotgalicoccus schoeneichii]
MINAHQTSNSTRFKLNYLDYFTQVFHVFTPNTRSLEKLNPCVTPSKLNINMLIDYSKKTVMSSFGRTTSEIKVYKWNNK